MWFVCVCSCLMLVMVGWGHVYDILGSGIFTRLDGEIAFPLFGFFSREERNSSLDLTF